MLKIEVSINDRLDGPSCANCGVPTRLLGTESHPDSARLCVLTYVCRDCDELIAVTMPVPKGDTALPAYSE